jgi:hypothetical protein
MKTSRSIVPGLQSVHSPRPSGARVYEWTAYPPFSISRNGVTHIYRDKHICGEGINPIPYNLKTAIAESCTGNVRSTLQPTPPGFLMGKLRKFCCRGLLGWCFALNPCICVGCGPWGIGIPTHKPLEPRWVDGLISKRSRSAIDPPCFAYVYCWSYVSPTPAVEKHGHWAKPSEAGDEGSNWVAAHPMMQVPAWRERQASARWEYDRTSHKGPQPCMSSMRSLRMQENGNGGIWDKNICKTAEPCNLHENAVPLQNGEGCGSERLYLPLNRIYCPSCGQGRWTKNTHIRRDNLGAPITCGGCKAKPRSLLWQCACDTPWATCDRHAILKAVETPKPKPKARAKAKGGSSSRPSIKRRIADADIGQLLEDDLRRVKVKTQGEFSPLDCEVMPQVKRRKLRPSLLPPGLRERFPDAIMSRELGSA